MCITAKNLSAKVSDGSFAIGPSQVVSPGYARYAAESGSKFIALMASLPGVAGLIENAAEMIQAPKPGPQIMSCGLSEDTSDY